MTTRRPSTLLLALGLAGLVHEAPAADSAWYLSPRVGYVFADHSVKADDGLGVGLALGRALDDRWNVEFGTQYHSLKHPGAGDLDLRTFGADALYFFKREPALSPYALAGLNLGSARMAGDQDYGLGANLGLGVMTGLGAGGTLRAEIRRRWMDSDLAGTGGSLVDWLFGVGLDIPLGSTAAHSPASLGAGAAASATPAAVADAPALASAASAIPPATPAAATDTPTPPAPKAADASASPAPATPASASEANAAAAPALSAPVMAPVTAVPVPVADGDADGIPDGADRCPATPAGRKVDAQGCEPDADADGVADALDNCPATPAGRTVNALGCEIDSDADGVVDALDKCPATPVGDKVGADGCTPDSDGDGVADARDVCPATPAGRAVNALGCEMDSDADGVVDAHDKCPATPAGRRVGADGCEIDSDGDGVVDSLDACPNTPQGDKVDEKGCTPGNSIVLKGVHFKSDSAELRPESQEVLNTAADVLKRYPHVDIEVAGHTDSTHTPEYNQKLSEERARAVCDYFVQKGIEAQRLRARGFGESKPVAGNRTATGRAENRRVELRIEDKP